MDKQFVKTGEAARILGTNPQVLRKWGERGVFPPAYTSPGGSRYYRISDLLGENGSASHSDGEVSLCYARVSSAGQKDDLVRQKELLESFCAAKGWSCEIVEDVGSGMNNKKKGLKYLLSRVLAGDIERLVVSHKDRLSRFSADMIFLLCEMQGIEVEIVNKGEELSFEEELAADVLEIITVFSARLYGKRSSKHKKILSLLEADIREGAEDETI